MATFNQSANEHIFKVVLVGASSVGKTAILERYVSGTFSEHYGATIGADFRTKETFVDESKALLQIWDTAGQERFRALAAPFYRGANICVLVFDVSDKSSFDAIDMWRNEFFTHADIENADTFPFLLIGNKVDLMNDRKVSEEDVKKYLQISGLTNIVYLEASAKNGDNITQIFDKIASICLSQSQNTSLYIMNEANNQMDNNQQEDDKISLEEVMSNPNENVKQAVSSACVYC